MRFKSILLLLCIGFLVNCSAQKLYLPDSLRQQVFALRYHSGFIFAHSVHIQNTKGVKPDGFEFEYSHLRTDSLANSRFKCFPRTGFSFTFTDYNSRILGKAYTAAYFLEPNYRLANNLSLIFRASGGLSYLTSPFDSVKNPVNHTYSTNINGYLALGLGFSFAVSRHIALYAMGNFFHNSNGGFKLPNAGANYINASLGIQYFSNSSHLPAYKKIKDSAWRNEHLHIEVSGYYSPKTGYDYKDTSKPVRKYVLGAQVQLVKRVGNLDAVTVAAEIYYDDALRSIKDIYIKDHSSATLAGLLIGHQFLLNRFTFSQQLGCYIFKQTKVYNDIYQNLFQTLYERWSLHYTVNTHFSAGISLLAHGDVADFIDARIIYRIR